MAGLVNAVKEVDLGDPLGFGLVRVLAGESIGIAVRRHHSLDALDAAAGPIRIVVPREVVTVTASFALGLFEPSVLHHGGIAGLRSHYLLLADSDLLQEIERGLEMAVRRESERPPRSRMSRWCAFLRGRRS